MQSLTGPLGPTPQALVGGAGGALSRSTVDAWTVPVSVSGEAASGLQGAPEAAEVRQDYQRPPITLPLPAGAHARVAQAAVGRPRSAPGGKASGPACKKPGASFPSDRSVGTLPRTQASCSAGKRGPRSLQGGPLQAGLHPGWGRPGAAHASPATEHRFPARAGLCLLTGLSPLLPLQRACHSASGPLHLRFQPPHTHDPRLSQAFPDC